MSGRRIPSGSGTLSLARGPILIVDDDPSDAFLSRRAVEASFPGVPIRVLESGKALIAFLEDESAASKNNEPVASAILLDLKMPEMDGFAVLDWIKAQPKYGQIPVIVVTVFEDLHHLKRAYALLARAYLLKPINADSFRNTVSSLNIVF
jgi:two-component system response regulator